MINLLPPDLKNSYQSHSKTYLVITFYIIATSVVTLVLVAIMSYSLILTGRLADQQIKIDTLIAEKQKKQELIVKAAFIQDRIQNASKYQETHDWPTILTNLAAQVPTDVQLTLLKVSNTQDAQPSIGLGGQTIDRRSIILFKDKLLDSGKFVQPEITSISEDTSHTQKSFNFTIGLKLSEANVVKK